MRVMLIIIGMRAGYQAEMNMATMTLSHSPPPLTEGAIFCISEITEMKDACR
jgi:hypothetical protein